MGTISFDCPKCKQRTEQAYCETGSARQRDIGICEHCAVPLEFTDNKGGVREISTFDAADRMDNYQAEEFFKLIGDIKSGEFKKRKDANLAKSTAELSAEVTNMDGPACRELVCRKLAVTIVDSQRKVESLTEILFDKDHQAKCYELAKAWVAGNLNDGVRNGVEKTYEDVARKVLRGVNEVDNIVNPIEALLKVLSMNLGE